MDAEAGLASLAVLQASQQQHKGGTAHAGPDCVLSGFTRASRASRAL